ncbi:MAG: endoplasmic reticulum vesicle transporter-domain-containing protein [Monoraphidium minutum]|nr:MAG: endoplasmic reticulum vesicle transporter-domain-containing protein [Monoraphidium minutum]
MAPIKLSSVSAFARPEEHLTRQTTYGGIVTLLGVLLASTLFIHELSWFLNARGVAKMEVDLQRRHDLTIYVDITFHAIPCAALSVDIIDAAGTADSDTNFAEGAHLHKVRLDASGRRIARGDAGEYHTPQTQRVENQGGEQVVAIDLGVAMQHLGEMEEEMGAHEGCRLRGDVTVRRVAGRLHFAVHQQSMADMLPQMLSGHVLPRVRNASHTVHSVTFGPSFPGQVSPLGGTRRIEGVESGGHAYKYYIKIVPTEYTTRFGSLLETSQYSVTEYAMPLYVAGDATHSAVRRDPFVDLVYDLSPIVMRIRQAPLGLLHFVVRLCAVVGGALSVTRLLDTLVDAVLRALGAPGGGRRGSASSGGGGGGGASFGGAGGLLPTRSGSHGGSVQGNGSLGGALSGALGGSGPLPRHSSGGGGLAGAGSAPLQHSYTGGGPPMPRLGSGGGSGGLQPRASASGSGMLSPLGGGAPPAGGFGISLPGGAGASGGGHFRQD